MMTNKPIRVLPFPRALGDPFPRLVIFGEHLSLEYGVIIPR
nr:hypothetical protein Q903MT_gene4888 [Picea sitchensis]